jgi:hypothetical protein
MKKVKGCYKWPRWRGMINFASNAPEEKDIMLAKVQAFNYGYRLGYESKGFDLLKETNEDKNRENGSI